MWPFFQQTDNFVTPTVKQDFAHNELSLTLWQLVHSPSLKNIKCFIQNAFFQANLCKTNLRYNLKLSFWGVRMLVNSTKLINRSINQTFDWQQCRSYRAQLEKFTIRKKWSAFLFIMVQLQQAQMKVPPHAAEYKRQYLEEQSRLCNTATR